MKKILENLWNDYLVDQCAIIDTEEERLLTKKLADLQEKLDLQLDKTHRSLLEEYVGILCDIDSLFAKKAFLKGCKFTASFILESSEDQSHNLT